MKAHLNPTNSLRGILLAAVVVLAGSAWAASRGTMDLQHPTNVAGTQLKSGSYTVEWQGTGDQVQLKIYRGKKNIVSTSARMVSIESPAPYDSSLVTDNGDGTRTLSQIRFGGKKFAIEVTNEGGSAGGAGASK